MRYVAQNPPHHDSGIYMEEEADRIQKPEIVIDSKETMPLGHNRTEANMNSQTLWQHTRPVKVQARTDPNTERRK